ncbi:MAG: hypothetical protein BGO44_15435 [Legionella sp. 39-23]|nr:MAG: hypothetical protein BGO44_15435 [Legionella sp. 39-23]
MIKAKQVISFSFSLNCTALNQSCNILSFKDTSEQSFYFDGDVCQRLIKPQTLANKAKTLGLANDSLDK